MAANHRETFKNQTSFSLQLTKHLFQMADEPNVVFSPLSIHILLSLISAGSKDQKLVQLLGFRSIEELNSLCSELVASVLADGSPLGGPKISCSNGIWIQEDYLPLKPSFNHVVSNVYRASVNPVDFTHEENEINTQVNSWAEEKTMGLIKQILSPGPANSSLRVILANALYFKGAWKTEFNAARTREYDFHLLNGSSVRVPFMAYNDDACVSEHDGFKILGLPYKRGQDKRGLFMYMILPDAKDGLPALVEKVAAEPAFLEKCLRVQNAMVGWLLIPKFKISFGFDASDVLGKLGCETTFCLTEMVDSPKGSSLTASGILHKSFIEVDEEGTRAAAVTVTGAWSALFPTVNFIADHPFLFLIRDHTTGVVLFIGRVLDPSISS